MMQVPAGQECGSQCPGICPRAAPYPLEATGGTLESLSGHPYSVFQGGR
jgi:hypothetical protein